MNVTIIGLGWLGLPLAESLHKGGHQVTGSVRTENKMKSTTIKSFLLSSNEKINIPEELASNTDVLILTIPPFNRDQPKLYGEFLVEITKAFQDLNQIIFTSSIGIYPKKGGIYDETFLFLENEKKSILYLAEQALIKHHKDKLLITRLGGLFGQDRHPALNLQGNEQVKNPYGLVNLVHRKDILRALHLLIQKNANGIYNIVSPEHPHRKEYYTKLYRYYNLKPIKFIETPWIEREISTAKLISEFDFTYQHSIYDVEHIFM